MIRTNQIIAALTVLAIISTTSLFAYGQASSGFSEYFAFDFVSLLAKVALAVAMLIIVFFARPRSFINRTIIGVVATSVLGYAAFGALSSTLPLGDAIVFLAGTMIAMLETIEATIPRRKYKAPASLLAPVEVEASEV